MIEEGDTVICRMQDEKATTMLKASGEQKVFKTYISMKNLVGAAYGSVFNIIGNDLELASLGSSLTSSSNGGATDVLSATEIGADKDNRGFNDTNTSQKLKDADIKQLRKSGYSGEDIIKTLIANSDTWNTKTEFSQEKWLKKKQRKYMRKMRIVKCTPATVCEVYHSKSREKICHLRPDSLSQILSRSSIYPGCRVLVVDSVIGLVVGSVAYRLRGLGQIHAVYNGQQPHFELVNSFNLDECSTKIIQPVPSNELASAGHDVRKFGFIDVVAVPDDCVGAEPAETVATETASTLSAETSAVEIGREGIGREGIRDRKTRSYNKSGRHPNELKLIRSQLREGFDSLIIASKFYPLPVLKEVISLLLPSSPFVIYFEFVEPLVECYLYLQENYLALRLILSDTWSREFQTLPNRVHPQMFMSTSSGYLLSGIYIGVVPVVSGANA